MRTLRIALTCVALLIANAAYADRIFDLEGTIKAKALGQSFTDDFSGTLTLFDDGTYTFDDDGDVSSGIWLQERNGIQLFREDPSVRENIAGLEQDLRDDGFNLKVTSVVEKEKIKLTKAGGIRVKGKTAITLRPGSKGSKPLRIKLSVNQVGLLR